LPKSRRAQFPPSPRAAAPNSAPPAGGPPIFLPTERSDFLKVFGRTPGGFFFIRVFSKDALTSSPFRCGTRFRGGCQARMRRAVPRRTCRGRDASRRVASIGQRLAPPVDAPAKAAADGSADSMHGSKVNRRVEGTCTIPCTIPTPIDMKMGRVFLTAENSF